MLRNPHENAIVNRSSNRCSSIFGLIGFPGWTVYAGSKHAVCGFTKSAALEYATKGIRINAVAPGPIDTALSSKGSGESSLLLLSLSLSLSPTGPFGRRQRSLIFANLRCSLSLSLSQSLSSPPPLEPTSHVSTHAAAGGHPQSYASFVPMKRLGAQRGRGGRRVATVRQRLLRHRPHPAGRRGRVRQTIDPLSVSLPLP